MKNFPTKKQEYVCVEGEKVRVEKLTLMERMVGEGGIYRVESEVKKTNEMVKFHEVINACEG